MKNPYAQLSNGLCFVFLDLSFFGIPDILPDFMGYLFFAYGIYLLPSFHNLKRWSKNFAIILIVVSFILELTQWLGVKTFWEIGIQFIQFLLIVFMYYLFQLLLHIHQEKPLESKTFKTYQIFMACMLCGFVFHAFAINIDAHIQKTVNFIGSLLQLFAFILFMNYCRASQRDEQKMNKPKIHSL
ncbi:hypothetical protein [Lysinibacillus cavernae]|uniref:hypothetical protein n=1 Tax=Lysinibacillus cavernae TaxID=2666135 RepID=UPI0012D908B8|nr:hypothetical protein [Lysinibacillus cavernae]